MAGASIYANPNAVSTTGTVSENGQPASRGGGNLRQDSQSNSTIGYKSSENSSDQLLRVVAVQAKAIRMRDTAITSQNTQLLSNFCESQRQLQPDVPNMTTHMHLNLDVF